MGMLRCVSGGGRAAARAKMANIQRQRREFMMLVLEIDMLVFNRIHVGGIYTCIRGNSWIYARQSLLVVVVNIYMWRAINSSAVPFVIARQRQLLASDRRSGARRARRAGRKLRSMQAVA